MAAATCSCTGTILGAGVCADAGMRVARNIPSAKMYLVCFTSMSRLLDSLFDL